MAFVQKITGSRPNDFIPFFEQTGDGKVRLQAAFDEAYSSFADLVQITTDADFAGSPNRLSWSATWTFVDFGAWMTFRDLISSMDPTLRDDRTDYYSRSGHTLRMEYKDETMDEFELLALVSPDGHVYRNFDGSTRESLPDGTKRFTTTSGEIRTYNLDSTVSIQSPDGTVRQVPVQDAPPADPKPFNMPEGIREPVIKLY